MLAFLHLIRFGNVLILLLFLFALQMNLSAPLRHSSLEFFFLCSSVALIMAAGNVINDLFDQDIDRIQKPQRPLVSGKINPRTAYLLYVLLNGLGFIACLRLGIWIIILHLCTIFALYAYARWMKKMFILSNLSIAFIASLPILDMLLMHQNLTSKWNSVLYFYMFFAFILTMIREGVKDIEDRHADSIHGVQSIPIRLGVKSTKKIICALLLLYLAGWIFFSMNLDMYGLFWMISNILMILPLPLFIFFLFKAENLKDFNHLSNAIKGYLLLGFLILFWI